MQHSLYRLVIASCSRLAFSVTLISGCISTFLPSPVRAETTLESSCSDSQPGEETDSRIDAELLSCDKPQKPILRLSDGISVKKALGLDDWLTISFSALSQNNGTTAGLTPSQFTSSNLFNLGLQIGPFSGLSTDDSTHSEEVPRPGLEKAHSNHFLRKILLNALFTQRSGGILSDYIPNQLNTQWNFGNGPIARLNILNLEYRNPDGFLSTIKLGKLMQAQDFTVNPIQCFYSNFGLCGWAQATPSMVQIPGNPFNSYGAVIKLGQSSKTRFKYGVYQLAPSTYAPKYHGLNFRFDQAIGTAHFMELNVPLWSPELLPASTDEMLRSAQPSDHDAANSLYESPLPPAVLTLGGWMANGKFQKLQSNGSGSQFGSQNNAIYGLASVKLPVQGLGMDHRLFVSSSLGLTPDVQSFRSGGSAGIVVAGVIPVRPFDTISAGMSYASYNPSQSMTRLDGYSFEPGTEVALELNYNLALSSSVSIMPNYQYIIRASGDASRAGVSVAGIQVWLHF